MIDVELIIRNYRCFGDEPARLRISDGFTALVGVNNSGKSSMLRLLYEIRPLLSIIGTDQGSFGSMLIHGMSPGAFWHPTLLEGERVQRAGTDRDVEIQIVVRDGPAGAFKHGSEQLVLSITYTPNGSTSAVLLTERGDVLGRPDSQAGEDILMEPFMAAAQELSEAMYIGPFRNAINIGAQQSYYDIQTGDAFVKNFANLKSGPNPTANEAVFQLMEDLKRIFSFKTLDLNATPAGQALQATVDGRSFRLTEQGAGLAHFVVILVNVLVRRPSLLLIDEPELNLHASLQLDFLSTLARNTRYGVVFATHNLGLARTVADRIYTFTKPAGGTSVVRPYEAERELATLLGQLSFDHRPELGFSKVLLVEGRTELRALVQFLRLYGKEHEVLMLPLHGDVLINGNVGQELSEVQRIGRDVQYLIDSERDAQGAPLRKNRQEFVDLCTGLRISGHVLERRALENYFPETALKRAFGDAATVLGPYEKRGPGRSWPKANNWRAAAEMSPE
jgi:ABC-type cobalamin/Fe3+-siderophores transport system ATPase subunit